MIKKLLLTFLVLGFSISIKAQLFNQDFSLSTLVLDYFSTVPNANQFNGLTTTNSKLTTSITNGVLQFERTDAASIYAYRNFNLTEKPTLVQLKFDFELSNYQSGTQNPAFSVFIGNSFSNASFGTNSTYASRFGIVGAPSSNYFSGNQSITFYPNPVKDSLQMQVPKSLEKLAIKVYTVQGKLYNQA